MYMSSTNSVQDKQKEVANGRQIGQENGEVRQNEDDQDGDGEDKYSLKTTCVELKKLLYSMKKPPFWKRFSEWVERKTQIKHSSAIIDVLLTLYLIFGTGAWALSLFLCFVCPFCASFIFLLSVHPRQRKSTMWLTYWSVLFPFYILQVVMSDVSTLNSLRIFHLSQTVIFLFVLYPETRGSQILYEEVTIPVFGRLHTLIDNLIREEEEEAFMD